MRGAWARFWIFALATASLLSVPVEAQQSCIDPRNLSALYKPGEPPPCPTPMLELVPSIIGRPTDFSAIELSACAGKMDAMKFFFPASYTDQEVDGEKYFAAAKARLEQPSLEVLEEWRRVGREQTIASLLAPEDEQFGGDFAHGFGQCSRVYWNWATQ
jgi:hypothetical protein